MEKDWKVSPEQVVRDIRRETRRKQAETVLIRLRTPWPPSQLTHPVDIEKP